jgi:phosphoribosyl-ATP pyrophosphohydrolase
MAKANTLSELADNIAERQMEQKDKASLTKADTSQVNKKIHAFGGEVAIVDRLSQGETVLGVARTLGISHTAFYDWVDRGGEARAAALARARARGGQSLAEETLEIADSATPQEAQVAKLRVDTRRWLASKMNEEYGDKQQALVNIDLGSMALDALRKRSLDVNTDR